MKILQICNKPPYPPKDGGCIAMNNITLGLLDTGHEVKVLAMNTPKHYTDLKALPEEYKIKTQFEAIFIDTSIKITDAFFNLFTTSSYNIKRFYSKDFENKLAELLKKNTYDIIQLESLYTTPYLKIIREYSKAKIILRTHNVEHKIWEQLSNSNKNQLKKIYLKILARRLKKYEIKHLNEVDGIAVISPEDAVLFKQMGCKSPTILIPFSIDCATYPVQSEKATTTSLFHLGSMDWQPNQEGILWFLNNVWNKLSKQHPSLKLYLAGRNMPDQIKRTTQKNVIVDGVINNPTEYMQSRSIMIVPLFSGSGMRVKIIEGMALGKTIISTSIGAEGILCENKKNILIANSSQEFIEAVNTCITDKPLNDSIQKNARMLVENHYDISKNTGKLISFYKEICNK